MNSLAIASIVFTGKRSASGADNGGREGRWYRDEHQRFVSALNKYGKEWKKVAAEVGTRTIVQVRTHAQKYFQKYAHSGNSIIATREDDNEFGGESGYYNYKSQKRVRQSKTSIAEKKHFYTPSFSSAMNRSSSYQYNPLFGNADAVYEYGQIEQQEDLISSIAGYKNYMQTSQGQYGYTAAVTPVSLESAASCSPPFINYHRTRAAPSISHMEAAQVLFTLKNLASWSEDASGSSALIRSTPTGSIRQENSVVDGSCIHDKSAIVAEPAAEVKIELKIEQTQNEATELSASPNAVVGVDMHLTTTATAPQQVTPAGHAAAIQVFQECSLPEVILKLPIVNKNNITDGVLRKRDLNLPPVIPTQKYPLVTNDTPSNDFNWSDYRMLSSTPIGAVHEGQQEMIYKPVESFSKRQWTDDEHQRFLLAMKMHGTDWRRVAQEVGTRSSEQVRLHAKKYF